MVGRGEQYLAVGIDLGGTNIKAAVVNGNGYILASNQVATLSAGGPDAVVDRMTELVTRVWQQAGLTGMRPDRIGVGVPGTVDAHTGTVIFAPNLGWSHFPLGESLGRRLGSPVWLENDADAAALGEHWVGAGRGMRYLLVITVGTGIGSGLILNGKLFQGSTGRGTEMGHFKVVEDGLPCGCGNKGCLETVSSASALVRMAREALTRGDKTTLSKNSDLDARDILAAARDGDGLARGILRKAAGYLGVALANMALALDLERVIIGGGVAAAGSLILEPVREQVTRLTRPYSKPEVVLGVLGNAAGSIGAAARVIPGSPHFALEGRET
ncbi:hypothetical protein SY88_03775 [Clostridiales bacterium PH28_bin88]|nr:hypothetical protein SY88_03775 [Clostridiales bacterium PH28_bin88]